MREPHFLASVRAAGAFHPETESPAFWGEISLVAEEVFCPTIRDQTKPLTSLSGVVMPSFLIETQLKKLLVLS